MQAFAEAVCRACSHGRLWLVLLTGTAIAAALTPPTAAGFGHGGRFDPLVSDATSHTAITYHHWFLARLDAAATATCSQLTKAQVQPLLDHPVTRLAVRPVSGILYGISEKQVGQTCTFADTETDTALAVVVIAGPAAARAYKDELHSLGPKLALVPVVSGGKGMRQRADSHGSVSTAEVGSLNGSKYCAVIPNDDVPGQARLEKAAGYTAAIGDRAYADIAAAIGTVCNRIYHSGSTNPAPALAALTKIKPTHTGGGSITVPTFPSS